MDHEDIDWPALRHAAIQVMQNAYAPYSGFPVGAAGLVNDGRIVALSCVDGSGTPIMPCGRCRQLLYENGGPDCLIESNHGPIRMAELLPHAFGPADLDRVAEPTLAPRLREWHGHGTVFVHPDSAAGERVWTAYWERSNGFGDDAASGRGILEEGPTWLDTESAVSWGRARTPRVVVVDADGSLSWAGAGDPPVGVPEKWVLEDERDD